MSAGVTGQKSTGCYKIGCGLFMDQAKASYGYRSVAETEAWFPQDVGP